MNESRKEIGKEIAYLKKLNATTITTNNVHICSAPMRERASKATTSPGRESADEPNQAKPAQPSDQAGKHTQTHSH